MEVQRKKVCYLSFDGMTDPLGQSQVVPYLIKLTEKGFDFHILSVEKPDLFQEKGSEMKVLLNKHNIKWTTIPYTNGIPFLSTALSLKKLYGLAEKVFLDTKFDLVHFRGYTVGNIVRKLKRKFKIPVVFDMRSFFPDERVLAGMWNLRNPLHLLIYKYFKFLEGKFYKEFDCTISQTHLGKETIKDWGYVEEYKKVKIVPCCADLDFFDYNNSISLSKPDLLEKLKLEKDDFILGYVGSIGTWYCLDDMMAFFKVLLIQKPNAKFVFLSPINPDVVFGAANRLGVEKGNIRVKFLDRKLMPTYISIFDWSIFFIKPGEGKAASCPVKHGELMGMGVPVIANAKVGDIDLVVGKEMSGLVVQAFKESEYENIVKEMSEFYCSKEKIREIGFKYYNLESGVNSYFNIYTDLLK